MIRRLVTINQSLFGVASAEEFDQLQADVISAAAAGAGFVDVPVLGDRTVRVMITPHHSVMFEERCLPDDDYLVSDSGVEQLGPNSDEFSDFDY